HLRAPWLDSMGPIWRSDWRQLDLDHGFDPSPVADVPAARADPPPVLPPSPVNDVEPPLGHDVELPPTSERDLGPGTDPGRSET
ncbi:MAG: hypothetical protein ACR2NR_20285, partial [Solirubrobacteraceae bacterium]